MSRVVLYGLGSPVVVDVEESLHRAGYEIAAAVRNHPAEVFYAGDLAPIGPEALDAERRSLPFIVPLFTPGHRQSGVRDARAHGLATALTLVDPTAVVPRRLEMDEGCYINAGCSLGACSRFGAFVFVNRGVGIGHHAELGAFVSIGPGAVLAGHVKMGRGAVVGAGATILPEVAIGANAVVGGGAVVTKDVPAECLVLGNPARIVRQGIQGYKGLAVS